MPSQSWQRSVFSLQRCRKLLKIQTVEESAIQKIGGVGGAVNDKVRQRGLSTPSSFGGLNALLRPSKRGNDELKITGFILDATFLQPKIFELWAKIRLSDSQGYRAERK
ncbi:hypothetical protein RUM44_004981 [Polyplax serrata]|uniref:Uncharacterized protein n=1 Tax=Polyplax serrata TaxID=468196 RepID=A0ABR1AWL5_POLSC